MVSINPIKHTRGRDALLNIDAATGGAFLDLTIAKAKELVEKMVSNQGRSDERLQPRTKGMHTVKETDMIAANWTS